MHEQVINVSRTERKKRKNPQMEFKICYLVKGSCFGL